MPEYYIHVDLESQDSSRYAELADIMLGADEGNFFFNYVIERSTNKAFYLGRGMFRAKLGYKDAPDGQAMNAVLEKTKGLVEELGEPYSVLVINNTISVGAKLKTRFLSDIDYFSTEGGGSGIEQVPNK